MVHPIFFDLLQAMQDIHSSGKGIGPEPTGREREGRETPVVSAPPAGSSPLHVVSTDHQERKP